MYHTIFCSNQKFDFLLTVPVVLKSTHPKKKQNRRLTSGPWNLDPMGILRNAFISRISSKFILTAVWILVLAIYYGIKKISIKDGLVEQVTPSKQQKAVPLFSSA